MNAEPIRFDGEVAVVTGAGNGLGRSYALELASRGAAVVCNDFVPDAAEATASEIAQRGGSAVAEASSVATQAGGEAIVAAGIDAFGSIDIVINNAGQLRNGAFEDLPVEHFEEVIQTHLAGSFYVTQPAYRHMKAAGYGRIIFTSSAAGVFGNSWQAAYAAAKAGVLGLCNVIATEGAPHGIKANAILPQALNTSIGVNAPPAFPPEEMEATAQVLRPVAPYMTVENVSPLAVYLASRRCAVTRRFFSVGCGHVARVFIAASDGWFAPDLSGMTPEQVESNLDAVCDLARFSTPESIHDEFRFIAQHLPPPRHER